MVYDSEIGLSVHVCNCSRDSCVPVVSFGICCLSWEQKGEVGLRKDRRRRGVYDTEQGFPTLVLLTLSDGIMWGLFCVLQVIEQHLWPLPTRSQYHPLSQPETSTDILPSTPWRMHLPPLSTHAGEPAFDWRALHGNMWTKQSADY